MARGLFVCVRACRYAQSLADNNAAVRYDLGFGLCHIISPVFGEVCHRVRAVSGSCFWGF